MQAGWQQGLLPGQLAAGGSPVPSRASSPGLGGGENSAKFRGSCSGAFLVDVEQLSTRSSGGGGGGGRGGLIGTELAAAGPPSWPAPAHSGPYPLGPTGGQALHHHQQQQQQQPPEGGWLGVVTGGRLEALHPHPPSYPPHGAAPHPHGGPLHTPQWQQQQQDDVQLLPQHAPTWGGSGTGAGPCSSSSAACSNSSGALPGQPLIPIFDAATESASSNQPGDPITFGAGHLQPQAAAAGAAPGVPQPPPKRKGGVKWAHTLTSSSADVEAGGADSSAGGTAASSGEVGGGQQLPGEPLYISGPPSASEGAAAAVAAGGGGGGVRRPPPVTITGATAVGAGAAEGGPGRGPGGAVPPPLGPVAPVSPRSSLNNSGGDANRAKSRLGRAGPALLITTDDGPPAAARGGSRSSSSGGGSSSSPRASAAHGALRAGLATSGGAPSGLKLPAARWLDPVTPRGLFSPRAAAVATPRSGLSSIFRQPSVEVFAQGDPEDLAGMELRLHVITFNMADKLPGTLPPELLQPPPEEPAATSTPTASSGGSKRGSAAGYGTQPDSSSGGASSSGDSNGTSSGSGSYNASLSNSSGSGSGSGSNGSSLNSSSLHTSSGGGSSGGSGGSNISSLNSSSSATAAEQQQQQPPPGAWRSGRPVAPWEAAPPQEGGLDTAFGDGRVDVYVVATQESGNLSEWDALLARTLGPRYTLLAAESLRGIHLVVLVARGLRPYCGPVAASSVATGLGNVIGNKGGVGISLQLGALRLLLISSHLAAHDEQVKRRNADFHRIRAGLFNNSSGSTPPPPDQQRLSALSRAASVAGPLLASAGPSGAWPADLGSPRTPSPTRDNWDAILAAANAPSSSSRASSPALSDFSEPLQRVSGAGSVMSGSDPGPRAASCPPGGPSSGGSSGREQPPPTLAAAAAAAGLFSGAAADSSGANSTAAAGGGGGLGFGFLLRRNSVAPAGVLGPGVSSGSSTSGDSGGGAWTGPTTTNRNSSLVVIPPGGDATAAHDVTLWCGDLNYRIRGNHRAVMFSIQRSLHEVLHANDQLRLQLKKGKVFEGFQEGPIAFAPTFKFLAGGNEYHPDRTPSWTDRVLWKVRSRQEALEALLAAPGDTNLPPPFQLRQLYYTSVPCVTSSDHKPVVAGFSLTLGSSAAAEPLLLSSSSRRSSGALLGQQRSSAESELQAVLSATLPPPGYPVSRPLSGAGRSGTWSAASSVGGGARASWAGSVTSRSGAPPHRQGCCCIM